MIFLTIKPTRCTSFTNLFLEWNSTCFGQFLCPSAGVRPCTHSNDISHTSLLTTCKQNQDGTFWSCSQAVSKPVWLTCIILLCIQWRTPAEGQKNCPKHVEFNSKNKFEKLVHLVCFIIRNLTRCTVTCTSDSYDLSTSGYFLGILGSHIVGETCTLRERDAVWNNSIRVDIRAINRGTINSWSWLQEYIACREQHLRNNF
jgi:hypothetical protein